MTKVVKLFRQPTTRLGLKRVRKRRKKSLEDYGQLNLFSQNEPTGKVVQLSTGKSFDQALTLDELGEVEEAKRAYQDAIKKGDRVADAYCNLGILESRNNSIKAIGCFTQSLRAAPRHFQSHYNLGNLYSEEKSYTLARLHYGIAIEIAPDFPNAYYNLGLVLAMIKEYKEAIGVLSKYQSMASAEELGKTKELIDGLRNSLIE